MRRQPSLRSQLNQIRLWVRQGRTDAWIAHKLDISIEELTRFKREHQLDEGEATRLAPRRPAVGPAARAGCSRSREERRGGRGARGGRAPGPAPARASRRAAAAERRRRGAASRARTATRSRARRASRGAAQVDEDDERTDGDGEPAGAAAGGAAAAAATAAGQRVRGHLRPRRGGIRPVARPGGRRQPGLRRALGGPSRRDGRRRGGLDHDPPGLGPTPPPRATSRTPTSLTPTSSRTDEFVAPTTLFLSRPWRWWRVRNRVGKGEGSASEARERRVVCSVKRMRGS